ncbi:MAG: hypothetical protein A2284_16345 [Deltaproteobacteria bacterium RIFOXYA12_FULL_61_11]|nr:MAG: hypothetical protein A2284_16345 [Deltaproteobacteria bacterium RIFOXYA12_FULL_61_11]
MLFERLRSRRGQTTTEYALIVGGVALVVFLLFKSQLYTMISTGLGLLSNQVSTGISGGNVIP